MIRLVSRLTCRQAASPKIDLYRLSQRLQSVQGPADPELFHVELTARAPFDFGVWRFILGLRERETRCRRIVIFQLRFDKNATNGVYCSACLRLGRKKKREREREQTHIYLHPAV